MEDGSLSNTKENIKKFTPKKQANKSVVEDEEEKPQRKTLKKKTETPIV